MFAGCNGLYDIRLTLRESTPEGELAITKIAGGIASPGGFVLPVLR